MNKLFAFLMLLVICVAAVGFYRSWFTVTSPSTNAESHEVNVGVTLDPDKVKADAETVKDKAAELTSQASAEAHEIVDQPSDSK